MSRGEGQPPFQSRAKKIKKNSQNPLTNPRKCGTIKTVEEVIHQTNKTFKVAHYQVWEKEVIMTNREFLNTIASADLPDEIKAFASAEIAKMDKRNAKRSSKPSKTAIANEPIKAAIVEVLTDKPQTASAIGVAVEQTTQKASALLVQLVKEGKAVAVDVKVKGKGKVKGYTLAESDEDENA